jgi:hypothetical protein
MGYVYIMIKQFYVCSYGGSGSTLLHKSLNKYGHSEHIHSRKPPDNLQYVGENKGGNAYREWFNGVNIPDNELENYYVIYIYRNPSFSIPSRFRIPEHLQHIQIDNTIKLEDVISSGEDLYKIKEFYDNYMIPNTKRNYKIYCVKYEELFDKQDELSKLLGIGKLDLVNKSSRIKSHPELDIIYSDLIDEMNKNDFIIIN